MVQLDDIKLKYHDATYAFKDKDKKTLLKNGAFDRNMLIDTVLTLTTICGTLFEMQNSSTIDEEKLSESFAKKAETLIEKVINKKFPEVESGGEKPKEDDQHIIVLESKDEENSGSFNERTWAEAVKSNISVKLKDVPVSKTFLDRAGKGRIILPDEKTCNDAKTVLENDFNVTKTAATSKLLLPKMKIHNIQVESFNTNEELSDLIVEKNKDVKELLQANEKSKLSVLFVDRKYKNAVIKVTPDVRSVLIRRTRIYVGMESLYISDHYHVDQCFACQGFGHRQDSDFCPKKEGTPVCMYCAGAHRSSECAHKKSFQSHKCINCFKSNVTQIRFHAHDHVAGSRKCPMFLRELDKVKSRTCFDTKNFPEM